jgi:hypothetical protein
METTKYYRGNHYYQSIVEELERYDSTNANYDGDSSVGKDQNWVTHLFIDHYRYIMPGLHEWRNTNFTN